MSDIVIDLAETSDDTNELEGMIRELKGEGFHIYQRSLPFGTNRIVAMNVPTFKEAMILVRGLKLKTKEEELNGKMRVIFYDILPNTVKIDDLLYNQDLMTTVGNKRKDVANAYFDLGD